MNRNRTDRLLNFAISNVKRYFIILFYFVHLVNIQAQSWSVEDSLGRLEQQKGNYRDAIVHQKRALLYSMDLNGEAHPNTIDSYFNLANLYFLMEEYDSANQHASKSLDILLGLESQIGSKNSWFTNAYILLFRINNKLMQYDLAKTYALKCIASIDVHESSDSLNLSDANKMLGDLSVIGRDFRSAERYYLKAIAFVPLALLESEVYINNLRVLAQLYLKVGTPNRSYDLLERAKKLGERVFGHNSLEYAAILNDCAVYNYYGKDFLNAKNQFEEILLIHDHLKLSGEQYFSNLGLCYVNLKDYVKAVEYLSKSMLYNLNHDTDSYIGDCIELMYANLLLGNVEQTFTLIKANEPLIMSKTGERSKLRLLYYDVKSRYMFAVGNPDSALTIQMEAVLGYKEKFEEKFGLFSAGELEPLIQKFRNQLNAALTYRWYVNQEHVGSDSTLSSIWRFSTNYQRNIAATLKNYMWLYGDDTSLVSKYDVYVRLKEDLGRELIMPKEQRDKDYENWIFQLDELERYFYGLVGDFRKEMSVIKPYDEIKLFELPKYEAYINIISFDRISIGDHFDSTFYGAFIYSGDSSNPKFVKLFEERQLSGLLVGDSIRTFGNLLYSDAQVRGVEHDISYGDSLYNLVWAPLEPYLIGMLKVHVQLSGLYHKLNLSAIPIDNEFTLMDRFDLCMVDSPFSVNDDDDEYFKFGKPLLMGGLDYTLDENLVKKYRSKKESDSKFYYQRNGSWQFLPGSQSEVKNISQFLTDKGIQPLLYTGKEGLEEVIKNADADTKPVHIMHLSTHGFYLSGKNAEKDLDPMFRSGLIFAGGNHAWQGGEVIPQMDDGILTSYEISNMRFSQLYLVVLSACETGRGDIRGGEGVMGLQRGFKLAGAQYILMTLWSVLDKETSEFMSLFYEELIKLNSVQDAFRSTQRKMKIKYKNEPYKWAGFVLVG